MEDDVYVVLHFFPDAEEADRCAFSIYIPIGDDFARSDEPVFTAFLNFGH